jgi:hypothetical protein
MGPPYKCPDCGIWWAGLEHRCRPTQTVTTGNPATFTVRCNCTYDDHGQRIGSTVWCPVHDVQVTYTRGLTDTAYMGTD